MAAIAEAIGASPRAIRLGIGDDAAAWKASPHHLSLITTDMLVDGVHFRCAETEPAALAHKALAQNLSDIAAMGGCPLLAVVALGLTHAVDEHWIRRFYAGMATLANSARCAIAGGDLTRAPALTIGLTVVGEVRTSRLKRRSGARPGDALLVSGSLGWAAAGLLLQDGSKARSVSGAHARRARQAYLLPSPRLREGRYFAASRAVHALMDISDGISIDLARMAIASGVDAIIDERMLCVDDGVDEIARAFERNPASLILNGGDDYELLAAVDNRGVDRLAIGFRHRFGRPLQRVGWFVPGNGQVWLQSEKARTQLTPAGYDHMLR
ncbi:MAG: thiamine-phosphate kinase [Candidatus Eremiobacteraeota bacterium]|nr:thiamine-phosphate kinase [Candidatus Eremiobacteraeota bacterium]